MTEFATMMKEDYGLKMRPITTRNPQANAILERVHQTIGNIIRTFEVQKHELDSEDPWTGILSATRFAIRATVHTTLQSTPMQLVFGRDAMLNIQHEANWKYIKALKEQRIIQNNKAENKARLSHAYKVGDRILVKNNSNSKYANTAYKGPFKVMAIFNNGTARIQMGPVTDIYNIRNLHPYHQ